MKRLLLALAVAPLLAGCVVVNERVHRAEPSAFQTSASAPARITAGMPDATPANVSTVDGLIIHRDVIYGHHDGMANVYDVIRPSNANGSAVLYMVSGGWVSRWSRSRAVSA